MNKGQFAPVERTEERRQDQPPRDAAGQKITPETLAPVPPVSARGAQFTDWASI